MKYCTISDKGQEEGHHLTSQLTRLAWTTDWGAYQNEETGETEKQWTKGYLPSKALSETLHMLAMSRQARGGKSSCIKWELEIKR